MFDQPGCNEGKLQQGSPTFRCGCHLLKLVVRPKYFRQRDELIIATVVGRVFYVLGICTRVY